MPKRVTRLYEQFQPENYQLELRLDRDAMSFNGTVTVHGRKTGRPSQRLTFHQKDLKITSAKIIKHDKKGDKELPVNRINNHNSLDEVRLHTGEMVYPGEYTITMEFSGKIKHEMNGIYPCPFKHDGKEKMLIATQFESHYARKAFPCIDEPEAKATFDLALTAPKNEATLSNTPAKHREIVGQNSVTTFETTPRMSTYLLAFVTGEMHSKTTKTKRGTTVKAWSTVAQPIDSLDFAANTAKACIEFFEDYFGVLYPLAKADYVALPDFAVGAMENWGLQTYRERLLVAYPGEASQNVKESVALVVGHETSHQWFGDLVTMKWWDDLWLNESFANMMEYEVVAAVFPEWEVWDSFIDYEGLSALRRDATPGVQPVKSTVNHPDEILTIFDPSIAYSKGGRLLYMLKNYIGEEAFRKGLTKYFNKYAYKNTSGSDLWDTLSDTSDIDVGAFMNPWLERSGFPVLTVRQAGKSIIIEQQHFLENPKKTDAKRLWPVPLFASDKSLPRQIDKKQFSAELKSESYVRLNTGAIGHYVVNYASPQHRRAIFDSVKNKEMSNTERLMTLNDSSMLARAGYQNYGEVLSLLNAYENETNESVWNILSMIIGEVKRFVDLDTKLEAKIKSFVRELIAKEHKRLGWTEKSGEPATDRKLRATIIGLGAYAEDQDIINTALELYTSYKKDPATVSNELRSVALGVAVKQKVPGAFDYLLGLHDKTDNSDLKADIASALTLTRSGSEAGKLLNRLTDNALVKPQDADRWLIYLLRNRYAREVAWDWMIENWSWIERTYKNEATYDSWPRYAASVCNTQEWANKYSQFFEPKQNQLSLKRNIQIGIEEIDNRVKWLERDLKSVQAFFKTRYR